MTNPTADVVIIGGGVMGCSILYNLAARGATNALLLERSVLGSGSTGRSQAICRTHYSNPFTAAMAWQSLQIYRDFPQRLGGPSGFVETGYFVMVGDDDRQAMESNVALNRTVGIDTYLVSLEDAATIAPMLDVNGVTAVAYEPRSGYADPYAVTTTYARAARELGATVQMGVEALSLQVENGRVTGVVTNQGTVATDTVVVAAGPWSPPLLGPLGFDIPLEPVRHQVVQIQRPWDILPQHPAVADIATKASFRPDGDQFTLIGVGEDEIVDRDSFNPAVDLEPAAAAFDRASRRMPALGQGYFRGGWLASSPSPPTGTRFGPGGRGGRGLLRRGIQRPRLQARPHDWGRHVGTGHRRPSHIRGHHAPADVPLRRGRLGTLQLPLLGAGLTCDYGFSLSPKAWMPARAQSSSSCDVPPLPRWPPRVRRCGTPATPPVPESCARPPSP